MKSIKIIKSFRGKQLLTQDDVANKLGMSRQMYNLCENDLLHCQLELILKILNVLKVNEEEAYEFFNALKQDYLSYKN